MPTSDTSKTKSTPKTRKGPAHPPYCELLDEAFESTDDRKGISTIMFGRYLEEQWGLTQSDARFKRHIKHAPDNAVAEGRILRTKNSYRLSAAARRELSPEEMRFPGVSFCDTRAEP